MPVATPVPVTTLNELTRDAAAAQLAPLFEGAAAFVRRLADARPFLDEDDLFDRALQIAMAMPVAEQVELLDAHPRVGAPPGSVSPASFIEQGYDLEAAGTRAESERAHVQARLDRLNDAYESRMGFRFVVFVAGRPRTTIVPELEARLERPRSVELQTGIRAVLAIARDRWRKPA